MNITIHVQLPPQSPDSDRALNRLFQLARALNASVNIDARTQQPAVVGK